MDRALASGAKAKKQQASDNQAVTQMGNSDFAICLAKILQKHPELEQIISVWPELPEHIKAAIKALVQTHSKGTK